MEHSYEEPVYLISVVAKVLCLHPQTLRQYEREGLIEPSRTEGKMRLYSQKDIDKIKLILRLTRDMGVNLAGVDVILQLKAQIEGLQNELLMMKSACKKEKSRAVVRHTSSFDLIFCDIKK